MESDRLTNQEVPTPWYRQTWLIILIFVFGAFRFKILMEGPVYDDPIYWLKVGGWLHLIIPVVFAAIMFRPPSNGQLKRPLGRRLLRCIFLGWFIQVAIRFSLQGPALYVLSVREGTLRDGVGGNVGTLLLGWLSALIFAFPFMVIASVLDSLSARKSRRQRLGEMTNA
jgi:hypothetical protein